MKNLLLFPEIHYQQAIVKVTFSFDKEVIALVKNQKGARFKCLNENEFCKLIFSYKPKSWCLKSVTFHIQNVVRKLKKEPPHVQAHLVFPNAQSQS